MTRGTPLIYQAALADTPWIGFADFLVRVESPCPRWAWSYEPWDAKLARSPRPEHLLQIALYGDLLATVQGRSAVQGWLMLGTGDHAVPYVAESFRLDEVRYYVRRAARRLEAFAADLPTELTPEPCAYCGKCHWLGECEARWEAEDHLCRVADITKQQMQRLSTAGVRTLALLAGLDSVHIAGIAPQTLKRLSQQARLQQESAATGVGVYETLDAPPGLGFDRLPAPDPHDLFFDFEGDPMHPGGLEYLCGVLWQAAPGEAEGEPVPGRPELRFQAFWAHDRVQEKRAFTELMAFLTSRLGRAPGAHLYHYAPYEKTALRRLASMHATAEGDGGRAAALEPHGGPVPGGARGGARRRAELLDQEPRALLHAGSCDAGRLGRRQHRRLRPVPRDRRGLVARRDPRLQPRRLPLHAAAARLAHRPRRGDRPLAAAPQSNRPRRPRRIAPRARSARRGSVTRRRSRPHSLQTRRRLMPGRGSSWRTSSAFTAARRSRPGGPSSTGRSAARRSSQDDADCLGGCVADGEDWIGREKRSFTFRYRYPEQETKLTAGSTVHLAAGGESAGTIVALDETARTVTVKRGMRQGELPRQASFIPGQPIGDRVLRDAVWAVAGDMAGGGSAFPHIHALLRRDPPRLTGRIPGAPIVAESDRDDPARLLEAAKRAVHALDRSWLVIQGPPGAGKTYTTSHLILSLVEAGKTVGVASNSHKAIDNVLHAVEARLAESGDAATPARPEEGWAGRRRLRGARLHRARCG